MAISTNQKPTMYRNLYENTGPVVQSSSENTYRAALWILDQPLAHFNKGNQQISEIYSNTYFIMISILYTVASIWLSTPPINHAIHNHVQNNWTPLTSFVKFPPLPKNLLNTLIPAVWCGLLVSQSPLVCSAAKSGLDAYCPAKCMQSLLMYNCKAPCDIIVVKLSPI